MKLARAHWILVVIRHDRSLTKGLQTVNYSWFSAKLRFCHQAVNSCWSWVTQEEKAKSTSGRRFGYSIPMDQTRLGMCG